MNKDCYCWECRRDIPAAAEFHGITEGMSRMFLCPTCGNKRCPRATSHLESCTSSNEPGQMGSRYGVYPNPNRRLFNFAAGRNPDDNGS